MNLILEKNIIFKTKIKDFGVDPVNKKIITTGDKLIFSENGKIEKEITGKVKNSELIRYIKEENQLFLSSNFFVSTIAGKVFKCDGIKKKITETIFDKEKIVEFLNFTTNGKIIYIENDILFSYDTRTNQLISSDCLLEDKKNTKGNYKIFVSGENIILKYRQIHTQTNIINIFNSELEKIFDIKTENNHIFSKIAGLEYIAGTTTGEVEIWNILEQEMYNSIKISNFKITYIEKTSENYFFGLSNGDLVITNLEFKILNKQNIFKDEILKICVIEDKIYMLGTENRIVEYKLLKNNDEYLEKKYKNEFLKKYNINEEYYDFFTLNKISKIENFIKQMEIQEINFTPKKENIFKALSDEISSRKVCLIGKDPYFQEGVATGLSFEVKKDSWLDAEVNTSLKNILKLIYRTYTGKLEDINEIRKNITENKFEILPPNKLFDHWKKEGVLLLNSALTTVVGKAGEHHHFWNEFTRELLEYISIKNNNIVYFLWGKDAEIFEKNILSGDIIKHNHPAICGNLSNEKDFLNGTSFKNTSHLISWTGYNTKIEKSDIENKGTLF